MRKILVIEDDLDLAKNLTELLEINEYQVLLATNGIEALEIVKNDRPDVIVSDVRMPGMDGAEFLQELRSNKLHRDIPFIFASAVVEPVEVRRLINLGADDFLLKPFSFDELDNVIKARLSRFSEFSISSKNLEWKFKHLLTSRELEIAKLVVQNFSASEIAGKLFVSRRTVENHKYNIINKLGVQPGKTLYSFLVENIS